jgi:endonuclease YncB( thermonuclease family)
MAFYLIKGTFRLANQTKRGLTGYEPDGDSIRFLPDNPENLEKLKRLKTAVTLDGPVNLRLEGIDALEIHYPSYKYHQPDDLAKGARDFLTAQIGLDPVSYVQPDGVRVRPPVTHDGAPGWILSRSLDIHGRPVSFVFAGKTDLQDGASVRLDAELLRQSLNFQLVQLGLAYPLFYDTLFADLRQSLARAARKAKNEGIGIWRYDRTMSGLELGDSNSLATKGYIFPKLFRRITDYFRQGGSDPEGFLSWLQDMKEPDQVMDLDNHANFTHLDNLLEIDGRMIHMVRNPDRLVFVSGK